MRVTPFSLILLLLLSAVRLGASDTVVVVGQPAAGGGGPTYLVAQDFEGAGYDNSETWTEAAGSPNEDYTTSPAPLVGSQSLFLDGTAATASTDSPVWADATTVYIYFQLNVSTLPGTGRELLRLMLNAGQSGQSELRIDGAGDLDFVHGTTVISTVDAMSTGTTYHVWIRYTAGGGADGVGELAWSTDGTKPTSGNKFATSSTANGTAQVDGLRLTCQFSTSGPAAIYDKVRVDDVPIGNNPE